LRERPFALSNSLMVALALPELIRERGTAMTLVQLRHLVALAKSGSFSRSAQALFLTQPALSRSIRALEDELG
jgi:DNA-binding MarR family transcriptional regulator